MDKETFLQILRCYTGCEVRLDTGEIGKIAYIDDCNDVWIYTEDSKVFASVGEFKLLLRRIGDMTKEEKKQFRSRENGDLHNSLLESAYRLSMGYSPKYTAEQVRYLNLIGVDTDRLLESEWAELKPE